MTLNIIEIIDKKSKGLSLSKEEINYFVNGTTTGNIKDYQLSALLMAIKINEFNDQETVDYARALIESGEVMAVDDELVDKHSSGGIGDKTSLALLPILGSMGLKVFKISGRGLGFTGGTIDKLESMNGFNVELSIDEVNKMVNEIGISITGQTPKLTPADGILYALRDVTATVDSPSLIAASIISKKIASGAKNILIDMKVGTGAFIENIDDAKELARLMKLIANDFDRNLFVLFSSMNQPLGLTAGNKIEVNESVNFLKGNCSNDFSDLVKKISIELYSKTKKVSIENALEKYDEVINSGKALELQKLWFKKHGIINFDKETIYNPKFKFEVKSKNDGYVSFKNVKEIGKALIDINAGRKHKDDKIDFDSGIKFNVKQGEFVNKGDTLFEIYSSNEVPKFVINKLLDNYIFDEKQTKPKVILGEIGW